MQKTEASLRERKRQQTREDIAAAALRLTLEHGLDAATIEAISAEANVSRRTFFNYFDSKDDALLAELDVRKVDALIEEVVANSADLSLRELAVRLFVEKIRVALARTDVSAARHELLGRHPHLFATAFRRMNDVQDAFSAAVSAVAQERHEADDSDAWADVLVAAAIGAVRRAVKEWTADEGTRPVDEIEDRANTILSTAWEKLQ